MGIIFQNRILIYALLGGLIIQIDWVRCYCLADLEKGFQRLELQEAVGGPEEVRGGQGEPW